MAGWYTVRLFVTRIGMRPSCLLGCEDLPSGGGLSCWKTFGWGGSCRVFEGWGVTSGAPTKAAVLISASHAKESPKAGFLGAPRRMQPRSVSLCLPSSRWLCPSGYLDMGFTDTSSVPTVGKDGHRDGIS